jgi:magnesium-transporting ATPase (P-type)
MLGTFVLEDQMKGNHTELNGMTLAFLTVAISQTFHSISMRSDKISIFSKQNERNLLLPTLIAISILLIIILAMISMYTGDEVSKILGMVKMGYAP